MRIERFVQMNLSRLIDVLLFRSFGKENELIVEYGIRIENDIFINVIIVDLIIKYIDCFMYKCFVQMNLSRF